LCFIRNDTDAEAVFQCEMQDLLDDIQRSGNHDVRGSDELFLRFLQQVVNGNRCNGGVRGIGPQLFDERFSLFGVDK